MMYAYYWEEFWLNRWDMSFLQSELIVSKNKLLLIMVRLQMNAIVLLFCIDRIVPKEICNIIRDYTQFNINYFRPEQYKMNEDFILDITSRSTTNLNSKFNHCMGNVGLYNLGKDDVTELSKYLKIGTVGVFNLPYYGSLCYAIIDINYEYNTICIIKSDEKDRNYFPKEGFLIMLTFDDFISLGNDYAKNNISNFNVKLNLSITKRDYGMLY